VFRRNREVGRRRAGRVDAGLDPYDGPDDMPAERRDRPAGPSRGPWDVADAPADDVPRFDLGSIRVPMVPGVQVQFKVDEASGELVGVSVGDDQTMMELSVFAAPKSRGLWDEVRDELVESLRHSGGACQVVTGAYGPEISARLPAGPGQLVPGRLLGVDGARWFLRAVITGRGAVDQAAALMLDQVLAGIVVVRGDEAMPLRDPLPLRMPRELLEQVEAAPPNQPGAAVSQAHPELAGPGARVAEIR
jgi:Protein of unknown function (DUF3710)